jgi:hypothetical protein
MVIIPIVQQKITSADSNTRWSWGSLHSRCRGVVCCVEGNGPTCALDDVNDTFLGVLPSAFKWKEERSEAHLRIISEELLNNNEGRGILRYSDGAYIVRQHTKMKTTWY